MANTTSKTDPARAKWSDRDIFQPKQGMPGRLHVTFGVVSFAAILGLWMILTYGGVVDPMFLPAPHSIVTEGWGMLVSGELLTHTWASLTTIIIGFVLAAMLAVPLGILMGSFKIVEAFVEPVGNFMRYLPVSAMIPLLILWLGIGRVEKVAVIFLGTFFQLIFLIADVSANIRKEMLESAYTLGARKRDVVWRVLIPAAMPGIFDNLRMTLGWAWTYLIVAELVSAKAGLGYMILQSMRGLNTEAIFVGLVVIGILGLITDQSFKLLTRVLLPWSEKAGY
jgi:NitT/TauT family transport system permease protein